MQVRLKPGADLDGFRAALRRLIAADVAPEKVSFAIGQAAGFDFGDAPSEPPTNAPPVPLSREAADLIRMVVCHVDDERYALLYQLVWRMRHGQRALMEMASDPLVNRLGLMRKAIKRDLHKMHAFVRFRRLEDEAGERFIAWFEPEHFIVEATASFFVERFRGSRWAILTPKGSLHWDTHALRIGPPGRREDAPETDAFEAGWRGYYESTFNPARLNTSAMRQHMPKKYWRNMSETQAIPQLVRSAHARVGEMLEQEPQMPTRKMPNKAVADMFDQGPKSLKELNRIIAESEPLVAGGSDRAVLGEGPLNADIAIVGEQPGDQEDVQGRPFVGPAGQLLMRALEDADIAREKAYITNAVKHFKFVQRGKLRLHQTPTAAEVKHYRWWLQREIGFVRPRLVVTLGATAALAMAGKAVAVTKARGPASFAMDYGDQPGFVTVHPSYLLRIPDEAEKARAWDAFVADLKAARAMARKLAA